jgi:hypothetical protein
MIGSTCRRAARSWLRAVTARRLPVTPHRSAEVGFGPAIAVRSGGWLVRRRPL